MTYNENIRHWFKENDEMFSLSDLPLIISVVQVFCEDNEISLNLSIHNSLKKETLISLDIDKSQTEYAD